VQDGKDKIDSLQQWRPVVPIYVKINTKGEMDYKASIVFITRMALYSFF